MMICLEEWPFILQFEVRHLQRKGSRRNQLIDLLQMDLHLMDLLQGRGRRRRQH